MERESRTGYVGGQKRKAVEVVDLGERKTVCGGREDVERGRRGRAMWKDEGTGGGSEGGREWRRFMQIIPKNFEISVRLFKLSLCKPGCVRVYLCVPCVCV